MTRNLARPDAMVSPGAPLIAGIKEAPPPLSGLCKQWHFSMQGWRERSDRTTYEWIRSEQTPSQISTEGNARTLIGFTLAFAFCLMALA